MYIKILKSIFYFIFKVCIKRIFWDKIDFCKLLVKLLFVKIFNKLLWSLKCKNYGISIIF